MGRESTHYQLLGLQGRQYASTLSPQEVKAAYRRALLQYHPDKRSDDVPDVTVDDIALAYKTLSEPALRAEYDRWLEASKCNAQVKGQPHHTGLETVDLDDLALDADTSSWSRGCRCGDDRGFLVMESELEKNVDDGELIVGCKGCSLWLRVLFKIEE